MGIPWPEVIRNEELWERAEQERINTLIRRRKWGWIGTPSENQQAMSPGMHLDGTHREREVELAPGTAGGER